MLDAGCSMLDPPSHPWTAGHRVSSVEYRRSGFDSWYKLPLVFILGLVVLSCGESAKHEAEPVGGANGEVHWRYIGETGP
jgi:hypothetical protein